jgi:hypothetical protein
LANQRAFEARDFAISYKLVDQGSGAFLRADPWNFGGWDTAALEATPVFPAMVNAASEIQTDAASIGDGVLPSLVTWCVARR